MITVGLVGLALIAGWFAHDAVTTPWGGHKGRHRQRRGEA